MHPNDSHLRASVKTRRVVRGKMQKLVLSAVCALGYHTNQDSATDNELLNIRISEKSSNTQ